MYLCYENAINDAKIHKFCLFLNMSLQIWNNVNKNKILTYRVER